MDKSKEVQIIESSNKSKAVVANEIARAQLLWLNKNNVFALRIFYDVISKIKKEDTDLKIYETPIKELKLGEITGKEFGKIKSAVKSLITAAIVLEDTINERIDAYSLFSHIKYQNGKAIIQSKINSDLKLFLLHLKTEFTMIQMGEFLTLSSQYYQQLYAYLKSWAGFQHKEIILKDLYKFLQVPKSCETNFAQFKRKILNSAVREINEKTSLKISYQEIYNGKKVEKINFIFKEQLDLPFGGADTTKASNCYHENRKKYENDKNHKCKYKASSAECQACIELKPEPAWIKTRTN